MGFGGSWDRNPISARDRRAAEAALEAALSVGISCFDHADIYTHGKSEEVFGQILGTRPDLRRQIRIQTKCGIRLADGDRVKDYDLSAAHILQSVEGSLQRLGVEVIDVLLLHRPDPLLDPHEIAEAWRRIVRDGKALRLGVSNMSAAQMRWLTATTDQPLVANQVEMSLAKRDWLEAGSCFNSDQGTSSSEWAGTIEYCRSEGIELQAWGALAQGRYVRAQAADPATSLLVRELADKYEASCEAILLAWLMRHPAAIRPVIGSLNPERIIGCAQAVRIRLDRQEWYRLYQTARGAELP